MNQNLITRQGYENLQQKLQRMQTVDRKSVIEEIARARESGNLDENYEYVQAMQQQDKLESDISGLVRFMEDCHVVDASSGNSNGTVEFGSTVTIRNLDTEVAKTFQLVGVTEFDVKEGRISYKSPIGNAMMGRQVGDDFEVETPGGEQYWEVEEIH
jgi:transcription elongation factor GreA